MSYRSVQHLALLSGMAIAAAVAPAPALALKHKRIVLEPAEQRTFALPGKVVRVATANENVVGVNVASPGGVILTGMKPGRAMVSVWEEGRSSPSVQYWVVVNPTAESMRSALGSELTKIKVDNVGSSLRMSGEISSLENHDAAVSTLTATSSGMASGGGSLWGGLFGRSSGSDSAVIDNSSSNFDVQVQLDVKVVEVSRSKLKSSGFYTHANTSGGYRVGLSGPSNLSGLDSTSGTRTILSSSGFLPKADAFNIFRWGAESMTVFSALESNGFAYTLAEPSLTALSGQTAVFLAGGEIPVPMRSTTGGESSLTVLWKEFGIRLGMTPTVLDANRITVKLAPEVSELDSSLSITAGGVSIPGLRVRRTETTVATGDGETFVISGLVSQQTSADIDKFPILGDIPILGAFFRSNRFDREDKELLMIVTPHLVRPFAKSAKLPALPGDEIKDYEPGYLRFLFLENGTFNQSDSGFSR